MSTALAGGFLTTAPPGKSQQEQFLCSVGVKSLTGFKKELEEWNLAQWAKSVLSRKFACEGEQRS